VKHAAVAIALTSAGCRFGFGPASGGVDDAATGQHGDSPKMVDGNAVIADVMVDVALPPRLVFLTPATYLGNLGGASTYPALDSACTSLANGAGHAGSFVVVLAFGGAGAAAHVALGQGRTIALVDGTVVATDATFFSGTHLASIDLDPAGATDTIVTEVWTNFMADGTALTNDCNGWTDSSAGMFGATGSTVASDATWSSDGTPRCNRVAHLMCIEQ
jgi:hypothetical protein